MAINARDIYEVVSGRDEEGDTRAVVKIQTSKIDRDSLEQAILDEIDMDNPVIEIHQNARQTIVNLIFDDPEDTDFLNAADLILKFQTAENSMNDTESPDLSLTILPKEIEGYFIYGANGIGLLQSTKPDKAYDMISLLFTNDCIHAYALDLDAIDSDELEAQSFIENHFGG